MEINKTGLTPVILSLNYDMMSYSYWTNSKENPSYYTKAALTYLSVFVSTVLLRYTLQYFIFHFQQHAQVILTCTCCFDKRHNMISPVYSALRALWQDRGVRNAVSRGYEYELNDSAI